MEEDKSNIEAIGLHLKEYAETQSKIAMLTAGEKTAEAAGAAAAGVVLGIVGLFFLVFLSFTAAFWLGDVLDNVYLGFLIVCGIYLILGIVLFLNKDNWLRLPVVNMMVKSFFKDFQ